MEDNKRFIKKFAKKVLALTILSVLIICILAGCVYFLTLDDGTYKAGDMTNAPYAVSQYTHNVSIEPNGEITTGMTAQELWDEMKKNGNSALKYLDSPEQLKKLMNAELITQYPDTRSNPDDEPINWEDDRLNDVNSNYVQGIVKIKRADIDGNNKYTMTYVNPETFQGYIDKYNASGSEEDRKEALKHFTLVTGSELNTSSSTNGSNISSVSGGLFIGDSILGTMSSYLETDGAKVLYQVSANANFYLGKTGCPHQDNNLGLSRGQDFDWSKISSLETPKFIYIVLGQNSCSGGASGVTSGIQDIRELVQKLQGQFPDVSIYINSVVPAGDNFSNNEKYNEGQVRANQLLQEYCSSTNGVTYVNTLEGYMGTDGKAITSLLSGDGLHPNSDGAKLLVKNITKGNNIEDVSEDDKNDENPEDDPEENEDEKDDNNEDKSEEGSSSYSQKVYIKVATWSEQTITTTSDDPEVQDSTTHTYKMNDTNINYQNVISRFTMPFDYLWSILTVTENVNLVMDIADLVYNSEIEITVHDKTETQTNESTNTYTKEIEEIKKDEEGKEIKETRTVEYTTTQTVVTTTNTLNIALTKADVWVETYTQKDPTSPPDVKEKTDPEAEEDNFVKILAQSKYSNSRYILTFDAYDWWMEILESNQSTVDMIDLTNYLLNALLGKDKFDTNFSFDEFNSDINNFAVADYAIYGGSIQEKVWFSLMSIVNNEYAVAGAMGNIDFESLGFKAEAVETEGTGIGLIQWSFGRADKLRYYASNIKKTDWTDVDTQIEFLIAEITGKGPAADYADKRVKRTYNR